MLPQADIQTDGGKAAILDYVKHHIAAHHIPLYVVLEHGEPVSSVKGFFDAIRKPVIARSSSPHEYEDFEGIFHSEHSITTYNGLEAAVAKVRQSTTSKRAKAYAAQHGFTIDERMHVIIQEQSPSSFQGAMMRHPNHPDLLYITVK
ncbi:hypothetical protein HYW21_06670 [Candidatus Woesearchaeota archaeon]|nr:hypothetical protein [Candidatus Woesearchaeota archaeon]